VAPRLGLTVPAAARLGLTVPAAARARARRPILALLAAWLVLALGGCAGQGGPTTGPGAQPPAPGPVPNTSVAAADGLANGSFDAPAPPPVVPGFEVGDLPERVTAPGAGGPVRLVIPAIAVATPLLRLGLEADGSMAVPADFDQAGWFAGGPAPGQVGPAVIAGHVDSRTGPAVFYRLRELRPGQAVLVERADGTRLRFVVSGARSYPKTGFPTGAVFGRSARPSCG